MREIADVVRDRLPDELGFAVLVFEFGGGPSGYISNASRQTTVSALRELADVIEQRRDFITPEEN